MGLLTPGTFPHVLHCRLQFVFSVCWRTQWHTGYVLPQFQLSAAALHHPLLDQTVVVRAAFNVSVLLACNWDMMVCIVSYLSMLKQLLAAVLPASHLVPVPSLHIQAILSMNSNPQKQKTDSLCHFDLYILRPFPAFVRCCEIFLVWFMAGDWSTYGDIYVQWKWSCRDIKSLLCI